MKTAPFYGLYFTGCFLQNNISKLISIKTWAI